MSWLFKQNCVSEALWTLGILNSHIWTCKFWEVVAKLWDECGTSLLWPSVPNISESLRALTLKHFQTCTAFLWDTLKHWGKWMISPRCPRCQDFLPGIFRLHVSYIFYFMMYLCTSKYIYCVCVCVCKYIMLFSCSVTSDSLWPHGLQHARLSCPSPFPKVSSNSCPLSQWCHPPILSSVVPFSCLQSFPASGSFLMSQLFSSGGQSLELQLQHQSFQWIIRINFL